MYRNTLHCIVREGWQQRFVSQVYCDQRVRQLGKLYREARADCVAIQHSKATTWCRRWAGHAGALALSIGARGRRVGVRGGGVGARHSRGRCAAWHAAQRAGARGTLRYYSLALRHDRGARPDSPTTWPRARATWACRLGQVGALCTWLSSDSVFFF